MALFTRVLEVSSDELKLGDSVRTLLMYPHTHVTVEA